MSAAPFKALYSAATHHSRSPPAGVRSMVCLHLWGSNLSTAKLGPPCCPSTPLHRPKHQGLLPALPPHTGLSHAVPLMKSKCHPLDGVPGQDSGLYPESPVERRSRWSRESEGTSGRQLLPVRCLLFLATFGIQPTALSIQQLPRAGEGDYAGEEQEGGRGPFHLPE